MNGTSSPGRAAGGYRAARTLSLTGFAILCAFSFVAPLKFGLPYTYNIDQSVPQTLLEAVFLSWPAEWGILMLLAAALCFLAGMAAGPPAVWKTNLLDTGMLAWSTAVLIALSAAGVRGGGLQSALVLLSYGLYYFLIRRLASTPLRRAVLFMTAGTALVAAAAYGFYQRYQGLDETMRQAVDLNLKELENADFLRRLQVKKIFSSFVYSNSFAAYLILWIPLVSGGMLFRTIRRRILGMIVLGSTVFVGFLTLLHKFDRLPIYAFHLATFPISVLYLLGLTRSQGAVLCLLAALLAAGTGYLAFFGKRFKTACAVLILSALAAGSTTAWWLRPIRDSVRVRYEYNRATLAMIRDHPLFGSGPGSYGTEYMHYRLPGAEEIQLAHNSFLQMFSEFGILGFCSIVFLFFAALRGHFLSRTPQGFLIGIALLAFGLHNLIDFDLFVPALGYVFFYFCSLSKHPGREKQRPLSKTASRALAIWGMLAAVVLGFAVFRIATGLSRHEAGLRFQRAGRFEHAVRCYLASADAYPYLPANLVRLAGSFEALGKFDLAEKTYALLIRNIPQNAMSRLKYARCLIRHDLANGRLRVDTVRRAFRKALEYYPTSGQIRKEWERYERWLRELRKRPPSPPRNRLPPKSHAG
jgi:hypothetical protein